MILYVDINDLCHLRCPTCPRGVRAIPNTAAVMPLGLFERIVEKAIDDGAYQIDLFDWTEPFLNPHLYQYVKAVREHGLPCGVNSTLSIKKIKNFEAALEHINYLLVTLSGISQSIYEINHSGGRIDFVLSNLEIIASLRRQGKPIPLTTVRFLLFDYNRHEVPNFEKTVQDLGFSCQVLIGSGNPLTKPANPNLTNADITSFGSERGNIRRRLSDFSPAAVNQTNQNICPLLFEHITVNAKGDVYQCSAYGRHPELRIGPYLELSREEILYRRFTHPICSSCTWSRRPPIAHERLALKQAFASHMGEAISDRVKRLSVPLGYIPKNEDGFQTPKPLDGAIPLDPDQFVFSTEDGFLKPIGPAALALEDANLKLAKLDAERGAAIAEFNRIKLECEALRRSTSWRVTAPLRWIRRQLSKPHTLAQEVVDASEPWKNSLSSGSS